MATRARYYDGKVALARELWIYGAPEGAQIGQPPDRIPRFGEGLLDMFDVTGF